MDDRRPKVTRMTKARLFDGACQLLAGRYPGEVNLRPRAGERLETPMGLGLLLLRVHGKGVDAWTDPRTISCYWPHRQVTAELDRRSRPGPTASPGDLEPIEAD